MKDAPSKTATELNSRVDREDRRFRFGVAAVATLALIVRVQDVLRTKVHAKLYGDALDYFLQGRSLADGHGYVQSLAPLRINSNLPPDAVVPTAAHPPGFTTLLGLLQMLGLTTPLQQRLVMCVIGTGTVILVVGTMNRLLGHRAAIIAGVIAAVYPQIWINDVLLMSESFFLFGLALGLFGVYGYLRGPRWQPMVVSSVGLTIAMSTRPEQAFLFPLILLPATLARRSLTWGTRLRHLGLAALFPLLVLAPWMLYNSNRFSKPVLYTTGFGQTMAQSNCDQTYSGPLLGSFSIKCMLDHLPPAPAKGEIPDEAVADAHYRRVAFDYIAAHRGELPKVIAAREGRTWGIFRPSQQNVIDRFVERRGSLDLIEWAQRAYWLLALLAFVGIWRFRTEGLALYPLIAEVGVTAFAAALTFGTTRYRAGVEICIVLLAAATIDYGWGRLRGRASGDSSVDSPRSECDTDAVPA